MLLRITTLFLFLFSLSTLCLSQRSTFIGVHFSDDRNETKFLDSGNSLTPFPKGSFELGLKIRKKLHENYSIDSGIKIKKFNFPIGIAGRQIDVYNFLIPIEFNYKFPVSKRNKIFLSPTLGGYLGYNPFQKTEFSGEGIGDNNIFRDDEFSYKFDADIKQNLAGANGGLGLEFTIFEESFVKIGYYFTRSFFKIYENETIYTRDNLHFDYGKINSHGLYKSILVDFYFPIN